MKISNLLYFLSFGLSTVIFKRKKPLFGTLILTDRCNLSCRHCGLSNINSKVYSYTQIKNDMQQLYQKGVRVLCFSGGEPLLWKDNGKTVKDLILEAKDMGFLFVTVATNGTIPIDLSEADFILVSLDGSKEIHNLIRGNTFDIILNNIRNSNSDKIFAFMAINKLNKSEIQNVCQIVRNEKNIRAVSFNFHTPFHGTEELALNPLEKKQCCDVITDMIHKNIPVLNLKSCFPNIIDNKFSTPCYQTVVIENGELLTCNRCIKEKDLCSHCGYFLTAEFSMVFDGKIRVVFDALRTYLKFV